ncbi:MAG: tetratricopeptide repeat protein, partial [Candidatus Thorarchaeota archaeon]
VEVEIQDSQEIDAEYACLMSMMLEPKNPAMWNALALVHMMSSRTEDAQEAIERSLDIDTSNSWTWSIWGDLLKQEGRIVEAERAYRMALELDPQNNRVMRQLVFIYDSRKAHPESLKLLECLLPLTPDDQELWDLHAAYLRREKK